jgi:hypothetical protein
MLGILKLWGRGDLAGMESEFWRQTLEAASLFFEQTANLIVYYGRVSGANSWIVGIG